MALRCCWGLDISCTHCAWGSGQKTGERSCVKRSLCHHTVRVRRCIRRQLLSHSLMCCFGQPINADFFFFFFHPSELRTFEWGDFVQGPLALPLPPRKASLPPAAMCLAPRTRASKRNARRSTRPPDSCSEVLQWPAYILCQFFKQSHVGLKYYNLHTKDYASCWKTDACLIRFPPGKQ